jgi:hypothetical protein
VPVIPAGVGVVADHRDGQQHVLTVDAHRRSFQQ